MSNRGPATSEVVPIQLAFRESISFDGTRKRYRIRRHDQALDFFLLAARFVTTIFCSGASVLCVSCPERKVSFDYMS
jgi:hypothetical protein